ncbi:fibronectin type III domain-containing protein [Myxococcus stipitatus]|uniref:fibronectin type III domain-containing protein n=1 Tax=Myxococcus stipitatus TaxID=83455 RepID=UPI003144E920
MGVESPGDGTWMGAPVAEGCAPDGGPSPDAGPPPDGGPGPDDSVLVTNTTRFHTAVGIAERPGDLATNPPEILVFDGARFLAIQGTPSPEGLRFKGVPQGPYYLNAGGRYVVTDARQVEVGSNRLGRPDAVYAEVGGIQSLNLNLSNLEPWRRGSILELASAQVDMSGDVYVPAEALPEGAISLNFDGASYSSYTGSRFPLFESAYRDRLYVNQLSPSSAGTLPDGRPLTYTALTRSVEVGTFDFLPDGASPMPVTARLQPAPVREFPLEWRLPQFTPFATQAHPRAEHSANTFSLLPAAHGVSEGWIGYSGTLLTLRPPAAPMANVTTRLRFGNPFPSNWGVVAIASASYRVMEPVPDGSGRLLRLSASNVVHDTLDNVIAGPVVPRVSPPRSLTIDGVPASTPRVVGTASPVIAWEPPALGTPSAYRVRLNRYDREAGLVLNVRFVDVPGSITQVRLPPDMLLPGSIYYLNVTAIEAPGFDVKRRPFRTNETLPHHSSDAISSLFTTP